MSSLGGLSRHGAEDDRVVPVHQRRHLDDRLLLPAARVIAGPLSERSFGLETPRGDVPFHGDLGRRRKGQVRDRAPDHVHGLAAYSAGHVVFADAGGRVESGHQVDQRVVAEGYGHRAGFVPAPVLLHDETPLLAPRDHDSQGAPVVDGDPVAPNVDPVGVRVLHDDRTTRSEVAAAVVFVPLRGGEPEHVDVAPRRHVLQ